MSVQRQLNALLFELQTAQSPLAQAKILARSWRTLRDLSPTDRRLLARHAGFDGAEQVLEGLATRKKGFAPAALLQMLNTARATDGATVAGILAGLRDPLQREETVARGADLISEVLRDGIADEPPQEIVDALDELHSVRAGRPGDARRGVGCAQRVATRSGATGDSAATFADEPERRGLARRPLAHRDNAPPLAESAPEATVTSPKAKPRPKPQPARKAPARVAPAEGWDHLGESSSREPPATRARESKAGNRRRRFQGPRISTPGRCSRLSAPSPPPFPV